MASSGYMTELTTESIWGTALDTTRFNNINVRLGGLVNFMIHGDAATDIVNTAIKPLLEQFCEEVLLDLYDASKAYSTVAPWNFIWANVTSFFIRHYNECKELFDEIRKVGNYTETVEVVSIAGFGGSSDL